MKSLLALLIVAAALFVGACNTNSGGSGTPTLNPNSGGSGAPTLNPVVSPVTSPESVPTASPSV